MGHLGPEAQEKLTEQVAEPYGLAKSGLGSGLVHWAGPGTAGSVKCWTYTTAPKAAMIGTIVGFVVVIVGHETEFVVPAPAIDDLFPSNAVAHFAPQFAETVQAPAETPVAWTVRQPVC